MTELKYAITGHTSGLGKAVSNLTNFRGFSRSNGFDISSASDRNKIIQESSDCDVFVNNAHCEFYQVDLLYELFEEWKNSNKLIINIGSNSSDGIKKFQHLYAIQKSALEKANEQLSYLNMSCKTMIIKFGWINSERVINNYNPSSYIDIDYAANLIVDLSKSKYRITELTILPE